MSQAIEPEVKDEPISQYVTVYLELACTDEEILCQAREIADFNWRQLVEHFDYQKI